MMRRTLVSKSAWYGLLALCLVLVMPLWAHLRLATEVEQAPITHCAASLQSNDAKLTTALEQLPLKLDSCGYCQLLLKTPLIPNTVFGLFKHSFQPVPAPQYSDRPWIAPHYRLSPARSPPLTVA